MGGYDHQTVAGVISTSTHGSGIGFGPLNDFVHSLDLVAGNGRVYRIEPSDGPTDPAAYAAHHGERRTLRQSDELFAAVSVAGYSMGVVYGHARGRAPRFLRSGSSTGSRSGRPRGRRGAAPQPALRSCSAPTTASTPTPAGHHAQPDRVAGEQVVRQARGTGASSCCPRSRSPNIINLVIDLRPSLCRSCSSAIRGLIKDEYDEVGHKGAQHRRGQSCPPRRRSACRTAGTSGGRRIIAVADERRRLGEAYQSSPISFRFVKGSPASVDDAGHDMMIELIQLTRVEGGYELLAAHRRRSGSWADVPAGQVSTLTGSHDLVRSMAGLRRLARRPPRARPRRRVRQPTCVHQARALGRSLPPPRRRQPERRHRPGGRRPHQPRAHELRLRVRAYRPRRPPSSAARCPQRAVDTESGRLGRARRRREHRVLNSSPACARKRRRTPSPATGANANATPRRRSRRCRPKPP